MLPQTEVSLENVGGHNPAKPPLPDGCCYGYMPDGEKVIWVDFPPESTENPFFFNPIRKRAILCVALFYAFVTSIAAGTWSIGQVSMMRDLNITSIQVSVGLSLFTWGFGFTPLVLAPISEEFGRKWTYIIAVVCYWLCHLFACLGKNLPTILIGRYLQGSAGSIGATLVGGTISDIYMPDDRGHPMCLFAVITMLGSGVGPIALSWVEANPKLEWRWIQWIQFIIIGAYVPIVILLMKETRAAQVLKTRAARMRKERGDEFGCRFLARAEAEKISYSHLIKVSCARPMKFLIFEPTVTFFSIWVALGWGVLFVMFAGLPYIFSNIYGFNITASGLVYITLCVASLAGYGVNFVTEYLYVKKKAKHGIEARLYTPMASGIAFAAGCYWFAFTGNASIHWIVPCIGIVIFITAILTIFIASLTYLSECYGSQASSAIAAQSFLRNIFAGCFALMTQPMFEKLTPRWGLFLFGCLAAILAPVPFIAFWKGPEIRARSKLSKQLLAEEARRIAHDLAGDNDPGDGMYEGEVDRKATPQNVEVKPADDGNQVLRTVTHQSIDSRH